jgi:hypothetical protein
VVVLHRGTVINPVAVVPVSGMVLRDSDLVADRMSAA